jgi:hypothetical protein
MMKIFMKINLIKLFTKTNISPIKIYDNLENDIIGKNKIDSLNKNNN